MQIDFRLEQRNEAIFGHRLTQFCLQLQLGVALAFQFRRIESKAGAGFLLQVFDGCLGPVHDAAQAVAILRHQDDRSAQGNRQGLLLEAERNTELAEQFANDAGGFIARDIFLDQQRIFFRKQATEDPVVGIVSMLGGGLIGEDAQAISHFHMRIGGQAEIASIAARRLRFELNGDQNRVARWGQMLNGVAHIVVERTFCQQSGAFVDAGRRAKMLQLFRNAPRGPRGFQRQLAKF